MEPGLRLTTLAAEGASSADVPRTLAPWAFDGATGQWMAMRPLYLSAPPARSPHGGFGSNYCYVKDYGLLVLAPINIGRVYTYSPYHNQWTWMPPNSPDSILPPVESDMCVAYDTKHSKVVWLNANSTNTSIPVSTWLYDIGTNRWDKPLIQNRPTRSIHDWYNAYGAMTYDSKNGLSVYVTADGRETWCLELDSMKWERRQMLGAPSSGGSMGEGMTYDPNRNRVIIFTNKNDEVWYCQLGAGLHGRPSPPSEIKLTTFSNSISINWKEPQTDNSVNILRYRIYGSQWDDNTRIFGIVPGPYELIDSTSGTTWNYSSVNLRDENLFTPI
jgi:hypothetical protein